MKIVQLVYHLGCGGGEKFVVNLSNQLAEMGHDVTLVQLRNDDDTFDIYFNKPFLSDKVTYKNLGLSKGFTFNKAITVMKAISHLKPDIVHSHLNVLPYYYILTLLPGKPKFIHTIHNIAEKETNIKWQQKLNHYFYKFNLITPITISEECKLSYINLYHLPAPICIDNGTPPIKPTIKIKEVRNEIEQRRSNPHAHIFLHVARFNESKNQKLLIESFNQVITEGINADLFIIGGPLDSLIGQELQSLACNRIHFLGSKSNVGDYMLCANYFIMSSLWEGLPISLIEAMSSGLLPISTPAGGIKDVIIDGYNGFLSADFTKEALISTINRAISTNIKKDDIYNTYLKSFSMESCAKAYEETYRQYVKNE